MTLIFSGFIILCLGVWFGWYLGYCRGWEAYSIYYQEVLSRSLSQDT